MVSGSLSVFRVQDGSCPRSGWSPNRGVSNQQRGWGRTGWLLLRGEQRRLLCQPQPSLPKRPWQGHLSGDASSFLGRAPSLVHLRGTACSFPGDLVPDEAGLRGLDQTGPGVLYG